MASKITEKQIYYLVLDKSGFFVGRTTRHPLSSPSNVGSGASGYVHWFGNQQLRQRLILWPLVGYCTRHDVPYAAACFCLQASMWDPSGAQPQLWMFTIHVPIYLKNQIQILNTHGETKKTNSDMNSVILQKRQIRTSIVSFTLFIILSSLPLFMLNLSFLVFFVFFEFGSEIFRSHRYI